MLNIHCKDKFIKARRRYNGCLFCVRHETRGNYVDVPQFLKCQSA